MLTNNSLNHCETLTQRYHKYLPTNKNIYNIFYLSLLRYYYQFASATNHYIMGRLGVTEILIILAVVLLLFGGKKIPELMKGLGSGIKEFKNAAKDDQPTDKKSKETK